MAEAQAHLRSVFCEAIAGKTAAERSEFLDRACHGQPELRARVEALLLADRDAGAFLHDPSTPAPDVLVEVGPGRMIGSYKLLEQIGEGGFGLVFVAEQQHPMRRKVAIKVL
jgi:eukaryotic-like serine/threonine-protein kinase